MTSFLTSDKYQEDFFWRSWSAKDLQGLAVMTDGVEVLSIDFKTGQPVPGFFHHVFQDFHKIIENERTSVLNRFLNSSAVNERTDDDKTLILAWRK